MPSMLLGRYLHILVIGPLVRVYLPLAIHLSSVAADGSTVSRTRNSNVHVYVCTWGPKDHENRRILQTRISGTPVFEPICSTIRFVYGLLLL